MSKILTNNILGFNLLYYSDADLNGIDLPRRIAWHVAKTGRKTYYQRAHEYCSGHGGNGFALLHANLCDHLVLSDIFEPGIASAQLTVNANKWNERVTTYCTESLDQTPVTEKWDLFIVNPPWSDRILPGPAVTDTQKRTMFDLDFKLHKTMYADIGCYLTDDADVYVLEDRRFSSENTWHDIIDQAGLKIYNSHALRWFLPRKDSCIKSCESAYIMHLIKK